ncbi:MAG: PRD domain-containing protein [Erysipelotrichaceae bacterium]|nr:PRD domain-containing protein [Erysipelotrichaceae bacterium]
MKTNKQRVYDFIVEYTKEFQTNVNEFPKFDTQFLSNQLNMQRSNISSILNQLVKENLIKKTNGRPVLYYLSQDVQLDNQIFSSLIGYDSSLKEVIQLTQAALTYPMHIPRILYIGQKGVGIRTLTQKIYEFACSIHLLQKNVPYTIYDCSSDNLQLLDNIFIKNNHGLILLRNADQLSKQTMTQLKSNIINDNTLNFILIVHMNEETDISYFKDDFNFIVHLTSLKNRSLIERYQFIEKFLQNEAKQLDKKIEVNYGLMQCLMIYPCSDNLIGLRNNIRYGVANALVKNKNKSEVIIELSDLPADVRKGLLYIKNNINQLETILDKNMNYVFYANKTLRYKDKNDSLNIYSRLDASYHDLSLQDADDYIYANIESQINDYLNHLTHDMTNDKFNTIVSEKIRNMVQEFLNNASIRFNQVYSNKIYYGICLHINNALIKNQNKQRISNDNIMNIIDNYDEEYIFVRKFMRELQNIFNIHLSIDETIIVTLIMTIHEEVEKNHYVTLLIAMHGHSTASSIVEVVKSLMPMRNIEYFNLLLEDDIEDSYESLKNKIIDINQGSGILVFYDMGSIHVMLDSIQEETHIPIRSIEVPIPLLAMSAGKQCEEGHSLDEVYKHVLHEYSDISYQRQNHKDIVIALSSIHENNSESIKRYLQTLEDYRDYQILDFNITDKQNLINKINEIQINGKVVGIVGTYNPDIFNIPYVDYQHLPHVYSIHELFANKQDDFDVLRYLTEQFDIFEYEDLKITLLPFVDQLENIFNETFDEDTKLGLIIHMGCLIDRLYKKQSSAVNFNMDHIKKDYLNEFKSVNEALLPLEEAFDITFSESDKATIVEIIINYRKRK